jgi:ADP-heptose:LPS heptosyltransferase
MTGINKLLIYRFGQIGDTVAALPSLWLLRTCFAEADFTLLSEIPRQGNQLPPEKVLPAGWPVQGFMKYRGGSSLGSFLSQAKVIFSLRWKRFDAVAYMAPSIRTPRQRKRDALFFRLAGIKRSFGFEGFPDDPYPRLATGSLAPVMNEAEALLRRLAISGLPSVKAGCGCTDLRITPKEQAAADQWWKNHDGPLRAPQGWFAVCTGSKWTSKQWPLDRYLEVGRRLMLEQGLLPVVVGGSEDRGTAEKLIASWGGGLCAAGDLSVRESAALLGGAAFYLGNDTGTMHLAASVGRPCVAIFSSVDWPGRWTPYGRGHQIFRVEVPCSGCLLQECNQEHQCLVATDVDSVYQACVTAASASALNLHRQVPP